ncbi:hypothetical protein E4U42_006564, partial [Claviceps africana]
LPAFVDYTPDTADARLDSNQLGALVLTHCTYHHNHLELGKLVMPDLFRPSRPFVFGPDHHAFLDRARADCYHHARRIADILADAARHGARLLSDACLPFFLYDSSRVMLYYVARLLDPTRPDADVRMREAVRAVESNARLLRLMSALFPVALSLSATVEGWLFKVHQSVGRDDLDLLDGLALDHGVDAHRTAIPPISDQPPCQSSTFSTQNPHARGPASWDGTSPAAPRDPRRSQHAPVKSGLQHERPVPDPHRPGPLQSMCDALHLDDLQRFLSWDMYGVMEMGGSVCNDDVDHGDSQS